MKVLVTGGAGYVGSVLIPHLLNRGYKVRVLDNLTYGGSGLLPHCLNPNFEFIKGDIRDPEAVQEAVWDADVIIHLAAIVGYPACKKNPQLAEEVNLGGTVNLNAARSKGQMVIFASTGSNYGHVADGVCTEETPLNPLTLYGVTKTEAEKRLLESGNVIVYRFATAFGLSPRLRLDLMINDFVYQAVVNHQLIVYERQFRRTFIHVQDMARSFLFAIDHAGEMRDGVFNVGSEVANLTKEDVALMIRDKVNYFLHFADIGTDEDQRDYEVSFSRIRNLGFNSMIPVEDGVDELIRGFRLISIPNPYSNVSSA